MTNELLLLGAAWLLYFAVHSGLAALPLKRVVAARWPALMPGYRLGFNVSAIVRLLLPMGMMIHLRGALLWQWQGAAAWVANGLAALAIVGFGWSLRGYDSGEFLGLRQLRDNERAVEDQEHFHISALHRYVRHPWYALALVILWTRDMDPALLVSAVLITLYFIVGSRLEERKLIIYHGDLYRRYRARVPPLIPLPWRYLSGHDATRLLTGQDRT
jgi:protein-S-isoprenylcysteine O-methyltransferase Ste14